MPAVIESDGIGLFNVKMSESRARKRAQGIILEQCPFCVCERWENP
jgi:hypothetical protein